MAVSGVSNGYTPLPNFQEMAAVMAARPAMAQLSSKAATAAVASSDVAAAATVSASAAASGSQTVDMYL